MSDQDIIFLSNKAVSFDKLGQIDAAIYFYNEAIKLLEHDNCSNKSIAADKIAEYKKRVEVLENSKITKRERSKSVPDVQILNKLLLDRINFILLEAFEYDDSNNPKDALELYLEAAELCIKNKKQCSDDTLKDKLTQLAIKAVERAESLKSISDVDNINDKDHSIPVMQSQDIPIYNDLDNLYIVDDFPEVDDSYNFKPQKNILSRRNSTYSKHEIDVLRHTSIINGRRYLPFMEGLDTTKERFSYPQSPFEDPDGLLILSPKQMTHFKHWSRPSAIAVPGPPTLFPNDIVIKVAGVPKRTYGDLDWASIRQTIVSDCSFVASLAVCAHHEVRFFNPKSRSAGIASKRRRGPLISNLIYPRDKTGLRSVYNPWGKYVVKFLINGVPRKVVIDDRLPVDRYDFPLCSYAASCGGGGHDADTNITEFWVSILEKAYLKVMGGYDFPGSNSNIDLHALTGWIPERVNAKDTDFNASFFYDKLIKRFHQGDVLVTLATGPLTDAQSEHTGLVSTHAYAMIDVKEVLGYKLFQLKNPWSHLRWKGNFSDRDRVHWDNTLNGPKLRSALAYDPDNAKQFDDGLFWIDFKSVLKFFDVFYLNWDPAMFPYTYCSHDRWDAAGICGSPVKDTYTLANNPQYRLTVGGGLGDSPRGGNGGQSSAAAVWILLTRHITDKDDFAKNKEFIAIIVYKTGGEKVYYPYDPPPYIDGVRINSPHYLCKMVVDGQSNESSQKFTLVISEYEKYNAIYYTLRVYSTREFSLEKLDDPYTYTKEFTNSWKGITAGGCPNHPETYVNNPCYRLETKGKSESGNKREQLLITLKAPKEYNVGIDLVTIDRNQNAATNRISTGSYKSGYCILKDDSFKRGIYNIVPSTYLPRQEGPYILSIHSTVPFEATPFKKSP